MRLFFLLLVSFNSLSQLKYLPESRNYTSTDTGYTQYNTPSLHNESKYVLTFDDGPHITRTPKILDILKKYKVKATFFVITSRINKQTSHIIKRMLDEGHIVANHGVEHHNSNNISREEFLDNIRSGFSKLKSTLSKFGVKLDKFYYRFPYAAYGNTNSYHHLNALRDLSLELFKKNCIHFVFWDHDSSDWVPTLSPKEMLVNIKAFEFGGAYYTYKIEILNGTRQIIKIKQDNYTPTKGGVLLFHDIQKRTVDSLDSILSFFKRNQIAIVSLGSTREYSESDFTGCDL